MTNNRQAFCGSTEVFWLRDSIGRGWLKELTEMELRRDFPSTHGQDYSRFTLTLTIQKLAWCAWRRFLTRQRRTELSSS